ncbi:MAG: 5-formyltetrahydrofolate cyclo-ligase [Chromatiales bacterium]|nr:5-formyltetrahydrofolate cyclo-ligase [Chromatiales bacterium]
MTATRTELRQRMRAQRRALSESAQLHAAHALRQTAIRGQLLHNHQNIAFYLCTDGEIDVLPLLQRAHAMGRHCFLPVLDSMARERLWFMPWQPGDRLIANHFGIGEPALGMRHRISAAHINLILMPLVAFDDQGNRLGMGGGFYDRSLAFLTRRKHWRRPALCGVAHEFQHVDALPSEAWDVPLDTCLTERRLIRFHRDHHPRRE